MEKYLDKSPTISPSAKVFSGAQIIGDVTLKDNVGVWYNAVLRADMAPIVIGENTNVQDGTIIHTDVDTPTIIGKDVTIGHGAIIHAATVSDGALIGMGSIILNNAHIGEHALVAAGTVVPPGKKVEPKTLVMGNPMKVIKTLSAEEIAQILANKNHYVKLLTEYE
ncbi:gamma carbonic anhydrase family protein [Liberiplasma polymorphum]|jgi:gamma-carbonic anhydrase|uniref:gamma carbonic anhydrase family protein n=1 Tax=Liberiplasma polymorphum TaxID=3374570 RepID=UPI003771907F